MKRQFQTMECTDSQSLHYNRCPSVQYPKNRYYTKYLLPQLIRNKAFMITFVAFIEDFPSDCSQFLFATWLSPFSQPTSLFEQENYSGRYTRTGRQCVAIVKLGGEGGVNLVFNIPGCCKACFEQKKTLHCLFTACSRPPSFHRKSIFYTACFELFCGGHGHLATLAAN